MAKESYFPLRDSRGEELAGVVRDGAHSDYGVMLFAIELAQFFWPR